MEPGSFLNGLGAKRYGTGIGTGVGMAVMFSPQPGDDPLVIVAKLFLIAAGPIASIIGDSIEKYAKAKYGCKDPVKAVTTVAPPVSATDPGNPSVPPTIVGGLKG